MLFRVKSNISLPKRRQANLYSRGKSLLSLKFRRSYFSLEHPVIFAEVQYQPDTDFYDRFISETTLYLRIHKPGRRWLALVIYPSRSVEKQAGIEFESFMSLPQLQRIYLEDYQDK